MSTVTDHKTADAADGFVDRLPPPWRPYLRLMRADRPIGVWLLFLPCLWGVIAARPDGMHAGQFWWLAILFFIGSFVMRSAGCAYNDFIDRDLDAAVERTKDRPIPAGAVSPRMALALVVGLSLIGLVVLLQLHPAAVLMGIGSLALVAGYPFMKRVTWWPQLWLGLTFNWGVLVGAAAVSGTVPLPALFLYGAGVCWTLGYDTIYALQDLEDDALAGIKSSARRLGDDVGRGVTFFYGATVALCAAAMVVGGAATWLPLLLAPAAHFVWQVRALDPESPARNLLLFKSNVWPGGMIAAAMLAL
ncbi:MAG: 4-hydroxybenzoate octaprenyltransferase [Pseudomonadota bacterium]